jgi:hypothetical protein
MSMTLDEAFEKYGEPIYVGSKHLIWRDAEQNRAIKATRPGYLEGGISIITSQGWQEPADPASPHPSTEEMTACMKAFGFSQVNLNDWQHVNGMVARNVKPGDFIKTAGGIVPIDIDLKGPANRN